MHIGDIRLSKNILLKDVLFVPEIKFNLISVNTLISDNKKPTELHFQALQHTLTYVAHIAGQGILLNGSNQLHLQAFSESDWTACLDSRHSVIAYILVLGNSPISWKSKKQTTVSNFSSEEESELPTKEQLADLLTKSLPSTQLLPLLSKLGVINITSSLRGMLSLLLLTIPPVHALHPITPFIRNSQQMSAALTNILLLGYQLLICHLRSFLVSLISSIYS
ncbi:uncharacterized protein LOC130821604 [Amaranthus tricolor]|uniref:uncharacterized protein LOC130821604 n=1 Tax=Amaranthus tricolor TaxID=29722 RepID=UPI002586564D|nr:uncharacterized protein LOC130821604 [Amaranthus tricolor]